MTAWDDHDGRRRLTGAEFGRYFMIEGILSAALEPPVAWRSARMG
jgi:hypothetical protein